MKGFDLNLSKFMVAAGLLLPAHRPGIVPRDYCAPGTSMPT